MVDGLWTGEFNANVNNISIGVGIMIFRKGKIFGGNATNYLIGHYATTGGRVVGQIQGTHYAGDPLTPMGMVAPGSSFELRFEGDVDGDQIQLEVSPAGQTVVRVKGQLTRRCGADIFADNGPITPHEGLWTADYTTNITNHSLGQGVLAVRRGRIFGGNANFYQTGAFTGDGAQLIGQAEWVHFAGEPMNLIGPIEPNQPVKMSYKGLLSGDHLSLDFEPEESSFNRVKGVLVKRIGPELFG